jgi:hypothetical protein
MLAGSPLHFVAVQAQLFDIFYDSISCVQIDTDVVHRDAWLLAVYDENCCVQNIARFIDLVLFC